MKYRKKKTKYVNYNELPMWIKKVEDKIK